MNILLHPAQFPVQHVTYQVRDKSGDIFPYVRYRVVTRERKEYVGVTSHEGTTLPIPTRYPDEMTIEFPDTAPDSLEDE
jgi:hypothetical protein